MSFTKKYSSALLWLALVSQGIRADPALQLALGGPQTVSGVDNFEVVATLKNTGDESLQLYNEPRGALSKIPTRSFKVTKASDGSHPKFIGIALKYTFDQANSFTTLAPGETVDVSHNLAHGYKFDSEGDYQVTPSNVFYYKDESGKPKRIDAEIVQSHTAKLTGNLKSHHVEKRKEKYNQAKKRALTATVANCAGNVTTDITSSMFVASLYAADAEKYLTLHNSTTDRYGAWFGTYEESNKARVLDHFTKIRSSDVKKYTYDCDCSEADDSTFAYVFPSEFGHIHLCGSYFRAEIAGTDSKAGTIIHEASHFTDNGGTDDIAYGHELALELAQTNSTEATLNADSHEYFAENSEPWLA